MKTSYPTDIDLQTLPVYDLTLDTPWNPNLEHDDDDFDFDFDNIRGVHAMATKHIMLTDDAELRDDVI